jgi:hypothetical protein
MIKKISHFFSKAIRSNAFVDELCDMDKKDMILSKKLILPLSIKI